MFTFFQARSPVLDEQSIQWQFQIFEWALRHFDAQIFFEHTILVLPSNDYFPGRANTSHAMAQLIFDKVRDYAAMGHWSCQLRSDQSCPASELSYRPMGALRDSSAKAGNTPISKDALPIFYDARQVNNPEAIIAGFAHSLARHLALMAQELPPGGADNWPHASEVLAVFMGFGLMFANSAFVYRNVACNSCQPTVVNRQAWLSQYDISYALAIFSVLKGLPVKQVSAHLKSALRGYFKKAYKDVVRHQVELERLNTFKKIA